MDPGFVRLCGRWSSLRFPAVCFGALWRASVPSVVFVDVAIPVVPLPLSVQLPNDSAGQPVRRLVRALLCAALLLVAYGCTTSPVRPPLKALPTDVVGNLAVGLLDVVEALPHTSAEAERIALSLPDEFMVRDGDAWAMVPSRVVVPPKDVILLSLQAAGVRAAGYSSLQAARAGGADVVIACVLRQAGIRVSGRGGLLDRAVRRVDAIVEMQILIVDARSSRRLWSGMLESRLSMDSGIVLPLNFTTESQALSFIGEARAQSMRALMTQAFYHVAMDLVAVLDRTRPR